MDNIVTPCQQTDAELWFSTEPGDQHLAKTLCRSCTARTACLRLALDHETGHSGVYGIYGGLNPAERTRLMIRSVA
jgi:hypothetical protein